jgi:hypothetical protein
LTPRVGAAADPSFRAPTRGVNFIDYDQLYRGANGIPDSNLPPGQDLATTFDCMASVGENGCGFEQPLEAVYQALHGQLAENHDFLRSDAILVVVFVTDEDDCSAPPNTDLFDPASTAQYGALTSYRCTRFGIECGDPPITMPYGESMGPITPCSSLPPARGGELFDINRYINFFQKPASQGGVKVDPDDVILVGITAPSAQGAASVITNGVVTLQHSCIAPSDPAFFGDPAVRIQQLIGSLPLANQQLTSICDTSYQQALQSLGRLIDHHRPLCVPFLFPDPTHPDCIVEDHTANADGTTTVTSIPACGSGALPCWRLVPQTDCPNHVDPDSQYRLQIDRDIRGAPPNTTAIIACNATPIGGGPLGDVPLCPP